MFGNLCEPWEVTWCEDITSFSPACTGFGAWAASEVLWQATGRRFGNCAVTVRPCRRECLADWPNELIWLDGIVSGVGYPWPTLIDGAWVNLACGKCTGGGCSCNTTSEVILGEPIHQLVSVEVDGVSLPASGWALYDDTRLVRTDGEWPTCQDWKVTSGVGSWKLIARFGAEVPQLGKLAAGVLAAEFAKLCCGQDCNLPPRVTRTVRQGVTHERINPIDALERGLTGLYIPDQFIRTFNPSGIHDRARAYSVDDFEPRLET